MSYGQEHNFYPLGPLENLMREAYDKLDADSASGVVFRIRGKIRADIMDKALQYLQKLHPKARCSIGFNTAGIPCFKVLDSCPPIPLIFQTAPSDSFQWQDAIQNVLYPPFLVQTGPLIRLLILEHPRREMTDLFIGFHHAIMDGASVISFTHELLSAYEAICDYQPLLDNISQLPMITGQPLPLTVSLPKKIRSLYSLVSFVVRKRWGGLWAQLPSCNGPYSHLIERHVLSVEQSESILNRCRQHGATLTGAVFAAGLMSLSNITTGHNKKFACRMPINLRGPTGYGVGPEHLGCLVSGFAEIYSLKKNVEFWPLARKGQHDLKQFVDNQGGHMAVNLSRFLKIKAGSPPPQRETLSIDNLGVVNLKPQYGALTLEELSFFSRRQFLGVSIILLFGTLSGRLNITFDGVNLPQKFFLDLQKEFFTLLNNYLLISKRSSC